VCGSAQTGSGKTAAFLLPALERLLLRDKRFSATRVVVVLPTRELASQCYHVCCKLAQFTDVRTCLAVGGLSLKAQETELRKRPDIVIGTPGRLLDLVKNSPSIHFDDVEVLVRSSVQTVVPCAMWRILCWH
jgi:ATP-dependent RNA helicase DDX27